MNQNDIAISIFNAIVQHKAMTGRNPNNDELQAVMPGSMKVFLQPTLSTLAKWGWIQWDGFNAESVIITRPTEVQHDPEDAARVIEQANRVIARQERKARRGRVAGMYPMPKKSIKAAQPRPAETPEQKIARIRSRIKHFTG